MSGDKETAKTSWQLFVYGIGGKCTVIYGIDPEGTVDRAVDAVVDEINDKNGIPATPNTIRILYTSKQLEYGQQYPLSKYQMMDKSSLFVVLRLEGGEGTAEVRVDESVKRSDKNGGSEEGVPDVGVVVETRVVEQQQGAAETLTAYCRSVLSAEKFEFFCPYISPVDNSNCNEKWEFYIVRQYGVLTPDEIKEFEIKITKNYMQKSLGLKNCPGCSTVCERVHSSAKRVTCLYCSRAPNPKFEFCWMCLGEWTLKSSETVCGNHGCSGRDPRLDILETCHKKDVGGGCVPQHEPAPPAVS